MFNIFPNQPQQALQGRRTRAEMHVGISAKDRTLTPAPQREARPAARIARQDSTCHN
jgi:hypothetical protein